MTAPIFTRAKQLVIVLAAVGGCAISSASAVAYVSVRDHQVSENSARLDKLEAVVPVVQTNLAVVQAQLDDIQTVLNRIDQRGARRDKEGQ